MQHVTQSPTEPGFVQNPYSFYDHARTLGPLVYWEAFGMPAAFGKRRSTRSSATAALAARPRHTRLRSLVLRAFTRRRIVGLAPDITTLANHLTDQFPDAPFDLLPAFCTEKPAIVTARLLGAPETKAPDLLRWSPWPSPTSLP